jgi:hypothetical protein
MRRTRWQDSEKAAKLLRTASCASISWPGAYWLYDVPQRAETIR